MPILYAFGAALCNSTIGIFSKLSMNSMTPDVVAFGKCLMSFIILSIPCILSKKHRSEICALAYNWHKILILSFLGIFVLYFFETAALATTSIGTVSFAIYGTGVITVICGHFFLNEKLNLVGYFGAVLIIGGVIVLSSGQANLSDSQGIWLAFIAGAGYSIFLVLSKFFTLGAGIEVLWWMMGFGSLYLSVPLLFSDNIFIDTMNVVSLFPLAVIPTIGGFYFTTKAIDKANASFVQLIEMSEPIFAITLGWMIFSEIPTSQEIVGGCLTLFGITLVGCSNTIEKRLFNWINKTKSNIQQQAK